MREMMKGEKAGGHSKPEKFVWRPLVTDITHGHVIELDSAAHRLSKSAQPCRTRTRTRLAKAAILMALLSHCFHLRHR